MSSICLHKDTHVCDTEVDKKEVYDVMAGEVSADSEEVKVV